jgi:hypothetical protein
MSAGLTIEQRKWWEPIANGFRWVAFIPGGMIGGLIAGIVASVFIGGNLWLVGHHFDSPMSRLIGAGVVGYTSVLFASNVAPTENKSVPAIVMAVLMFMLYGIAILGSIATKDWFQVAQWIAGVTATAVAMHQLITGKG